MKITTRLKTTCGLFISAFLFLTVLLFPQLTFAQIIEGDLKFKRKSQTHKLIFWEDDIAMEGRILKMDEETITFLYNKKELSLKRKDIAKIFIKNKQFRESNITSIGYSPTAFNLRKDERRYDNYYLFFNSYSAGLNNNISFTTGLFVLPTFNNNFFLSVLARMRFTHSISENLHIGVIPAIGHTNYFENEYDFYFMPSIAISLGKSAKFLNFSYTRFIYTNTTPKYVGINPSPSIIEEKDIFSIGGSLKLSNRWILLVDNSIQIETYDFDEMSFVPSISMKRRSNLNSEFTFGVFLYLDRSKVTQSFRSDSITTDIYFGPILRFSKYF